MDERLGTEIEAKREAGILSEEPLTEDEIAEDDHTALITEPMAELYAEKRSGSMSDNAKTQQEIRDELPEPLANAARAGDHMANEYHKEKYGEPLPEFADEEADRCLDSSAESTDASDSESPTPTSKDVQKLTQENAVFDIGETVGYIKGRHGVVVGYVPAPPEVDDPRANELWKELINRAVMDEYEGIALNGAIDDPWYVVKREPGMTTVFDADELTPASDDQEDTPRFE